MLNSSLRLFVRPGDVATWPNNQSADLTTRRRPTADRNCCRLARLRYPLHPGNKKGKGQASERASTYREQRLKHYRATSLKHLTTRRIARESRKRSDNGRRRSARSRPSSPSTQFTVHQFFSRLPCCILAVHAADPFVIRASERSAQRK